MNLARKIEALMVMLTREHLNELSKAERERFADRCLFLSMMADPPVKQEFKSGVLCELKNYRRES